MPYSLDEFSLIKKYFASQAVERDDVIIGVGDDAATLRVKPGQDLVMTADVLLNGVHFPETTDPFAIGFKAMAVNLSDLAAMGATPAWATLNLSLPTAAPEWLSAFASGLFELARRYSVQLVGGDTARGPLAVAMQLTGMVPTGQAIPRSGAQTDDDIYVSGSLGDAALGLWIIDGDTRFSSQERDRLVARLEYPEPRVRLGEKLRGLARAAIDVSDGLAADLGHIAEHSDVAAVVNLEALPLSPEYKNHFNDVGWEPALAGGDDYELCFTASATMRTELDALAQTLRLPLTRIGKIESGTGVTLLTHDGQEYRPRQGGYRHFEASN